MLFDSPAPFAEVLAKLKAAGKLPTGLTPGQVRAIDASLRRYAQNASSEMIGKLVEGYSKTLLDLVNPQQEAREGRERTVTVGANPATARAALHQLLQAAGEDPNSFRVDFALKVGQAVANGAGRELQQNLNPDVLDEYPACEFIRLHEREVPRGLKKGKDGELVDDPDQDWPTRWANAADQAGDTKSREILDSTGRMVALKSSALWQALGEGAGGYTDTLGNSFDPIAFNTGFRKMEIDREETESLGLLQPGEPAQPAAIDFTNLFAFGGVA